MKREKNNKGFSLVELIIVIAIMVILVAVIVPQYLKYVNNSRVSVDVQTASEMATAIDVAVASSGGTAVFDADLATTLSRAGITSIPNSKYTGNNTCWYVSGNDTQGVQIIKITVSGDAAGTWQVYPNPDDTTDGYNTKCKK